MKIVTRDSFRLLPRNSDWSQLFPPRSKPGSSGPTPKTSEEVHIRNPRARALWEKWQQVGFMAYDRMRRLYDKLKYLQELEDLKNFSWEEWRKRVSISLSFWVEKSFENSKKNLKFD